MFASSNEETSPIQINSTSNVGSNYEKRIEKYELKLQEVVTVVAIDSEKNYIACGTVHNKEKTKATVLVQKTTAPNTGNISHYKQFKGLSSISGIAFSSGFMLCSDFYGNYTINTSYSEMQPTRDGDSESKFVVRRVSGITKICTVALSPPEDDVIFACFGTPKAAILYSLNYEDLGHTLKKLHYFHRRGDVHGLAFLRTKDSNVPLRLAIGGWDNLVEVHCLKSWCCVFSVKQTARIDTLAVSPDGAYLAFGGLGKVVEVYSYFGSRPASPDEKNIEELRLKNSARLDTNLSSFDSSFDETSVSEVNQSSFKHQASTESFMSKGTIEEKCETPITELKTQSPSSQPTRMIEAIKKRSTGFGRSLNGRIGPMIDASKALPADEKTHPSPPVSDRGKTYSSSSAHNQDSAPRSQPEDFGHPCQLELPKATEPHRIEIWECLQPLKLKQDILSLSLSGEGNEVKMAVGLDGKMLKVFDVGTGVQFAEIERPDRVGAVALSQDGTYLAAGDFGKTLLMQSLFGGFAFSRYQRAPNYAGEPRPLSVVVAICLSEDAKYLATATDGGEIYWYCTELFMEPFEVSECNPIWPQVEYVVDADSKNLCNMAMCCDGRTVATGGWHTKVFVLYIKHDPFSSNLKCGWSHSVSVIECADFAWALSLRVLRDQYLILAVGDWSGETYLYNLTHMRSGSITGVESDGTSVKELPSEEKEASFKNAGNVARAANAFSSTRKHQQLINRGSNLLCNQRILREDRVFGLCLSKDCRLLAVGGRDKKAALYSLNWDSSKKGVLSCSWVLADTIERPDRIYCITISNDGKQLALGGVEKAICVYDIIDRSGLHRKYSQMAAVELVKFERGGIVRCVTFTGHHLLAAFAEDDFVIVYSTAEHRLEPVFQVPAYEVRPGSGVSFSQTGCLAILNQNNIEIFGSMSDGGYMLGDRPSFDIMKMMLTFPTSCLKIILDANPTLVNSIEESTGKTLLQACIEENKYSDASLDLLISSTNTIGLLTDKKGNSAISVAVSRGSKWNVETLLDSIIDGNISGNEHSLKILMDSKVPITTNRSGQGVKPLFEQLGTLFPDVLVKFLRDLQAIECDRKVLGNDQPVACISKRKYAVSELRSPENLWKNQLEKRPFCFTFKGQGGYEVHVNPYRVPLPGLAQYFDEDCFSQSDFQTESCSTSFRSTIGLQRALPHQVSPLAVIVKAAGCSKDYSVFEENTVVHALVLFKWQTVRWLFYLESIVFIVYLFAASYCAIAYYSGDSNRFSRFFELDNEEDSSLNESESVKLKNFPGVILILALSPVFLLKELAQYFQDLTRTGNPLTALWIHFKDDVWNLIDVGAFSLQIVVAVRFVHFHERRDSLRHLASFAILVLFSKLFFYARGYTELGIMVAMIKATLYNIAYFLVVVFITLIGFSLSLAVLEYDSEEFSTFSTSLRSTTLLIFGDYESLANSVVHDSAMFPIIFCLMMIFIVLVFFNLLIALMNDSYAEVRDHAKVEVCLDRAKLIVEVEGMGKLCVDAWQKLCRFACRKKQKTLRHSNYIHVLQPVVPLHDDFQEKYNFTELSLLVEDFGRKQCHLNQKMEKQFKEVQNRYDDLEGTLRKGFKTLHDAINSIPKVEPKMNSNQVQVIGTEGSVFSEEARDSSDSDNSKFDVPFVLWALNKFKKTVKYTRPEDVRHEELKRTPLARGHQRLTPVTSPTHNKLRIITQLGSQINRGGKRSHCPSSQLSETSL